MHTHKHIHIYTHTHIKEKERQNLKSAEGKKIIKIRAEINEIETNNSKDQ